MTYTSADFLLPPEALLVILAAFNNNEMECHNGELQSTSSETLILMNQSAHLIYCLYESALL